MNWHVTRPRLQFMCAISPTRRHAGAMELESPFDLLGLYHGVSLDQKSVDDLPQDLDHVYLYRRPILEYWEEQVVT